MVKHTQNGFIRRERLKEGGVHKLFLILGGVLKTKSFTSMFPFFFKIVIFQKSHYDY